MKILVISNNYPSDFAPNYGAFVYNLMQKIATSNDITVLAPRKIHTLFNKKIGNYGVEKCTVLRPSYFSFSNKKLAGIDLNKISRWAYSRAINRALNQTSKPDIIYCHFLLNAIPIIGFANANNIPIVVASGESSYSFWNRLPSFIQKNLRDNIDHFICVSNRNRDELSKIGFDEKIMDVIPNAVDYDLFKPIEKKNCRWQLDLPQDKFIVGFIGHFIHRKGPNRIIEAIKSIGDKSIHLVCVGNKGELLENDFTTEMAPVANGDLPIIYNSFDLFVLPTLSEGHCNVIEEAKACGVPIISSKGTSVEGQIDDEIGCLIDPLNIDELAEAINKLKNNDKVMMGMRQKLIERRGTNSLDERARKVTIVLKEQVERN